MVVLSDTDNLTMWVCEKYGVSMLASHATDICARRFAAANNKGTGDGISFSHCRTCARGRTEYKLAGRKKTALPLKKTINQPQDKPEGLRCEKQVMDNSSVRPQRKEQELHGGKKTTKIRKSPEELL